MTRRLILAAALAAAIAACTRGSNRADSVDAAVPAIDTLKPVTASDTSASVTGSEVTERANPGVKSRTEPLRAKTPPATSTRPRDSAFSPPRNLPRLDTVKKKP